MESSGKCSSLLQDKHVAIIGAGMGGLATALSLAKQGFTHIDVYEAASNLGFVGAGIQLAPNMARILDRLGVWQDIEKEAVDLKETSIRQGSTDQQLAHVDLNYIRSQYGYPHMVGHRSSLAGALFSGCQKHSSITFHFSSSVAEVVEFRPQPTFKIKPRSGDEYVVKADILLAADGVKSIVRQYMLAARNVNANIVDTGQAAYRVMLSRGQMAQDDELLALLDRECATRWIGEKRHVIAYPVSNKTIYNISTIQPDVNFASAPTTTYTTKGSKAEMLKVFDDFCPRVTKMLQLVPEGEVCEWKLRVHEPLPFWTHEQVALVGDACHPTLPHLAQGAAQAIEDAAVLGVVLARSPNATPEGIAKTLRVYENVRKERAYTLVNLAAASGKSLHLSEGNAQQERDKQFAALRNSKSGAVPDKWADAEVQKMIYGEDIMQTAAALFDKMYAKA